MSIRAKLLKRIIGYQIQRDMRVDDPLAQRANFEKSAGWLKTPSDVILETVQAGGVPSEWITTSKTQDDLVFLHLHGGAFYAGSVNTSREFISRLARQSGMRALSIDYRLAPEYPYPAALEDATGAYRWLLAGGVDPGKLVLTGDSSGGGLALASLIKLRDAGDPLPAAAVCLSPWTDLALTGDSIQRKAKVDPINKISYMRRSSRLYAGEHDLKSELISPLYADLRGLPPLLIQVGSEETLLDDSTRLAERARAAGVEVELEIWDGLFHIFPVYARFLPEARRALERIVAFMHAHLAPTPPATGR